MIHTRAEYNQRWRQIQNLMPSTTCQTTSPSIHAIWDKGHSVKRLIVVHWAGGYLAWLYGLYDYETGKNLWFDDTSKGENWKCVGDGAVWPPQILWTQAIFKKKVLAYVGLRLTICVCVHTVPQVNQTNDVYFRSLSSMSYHIHWT